MKLSKTQKIAKFFSSKEKFAAMEEESKKWEFVCSSCTAKSNIWEIGGIRYKAKGEPRISVKCPKCGKVAVEKLVKLETQ